jgi:hypothetical protein
VVPRGSARPEAATMARVAGDLVAEAAAAVRRKEMRWWSREGGAARREAADPGGVGIRGRGRAGGPWI